MIHSSTNKKIKAYLEGFIQGMIDAHKISIIKSKKPKAVNINKLERSKILETTFEEVARMMGETNYARSERGFRIEGEVSGEAIRTIEKIVNDIGTGGMRTSYLELVDKVVKTSINNKQQRRRIADLYLMDKKGHELFFEIKSPKPNKGQCLEATDRLLQIHAIKRKGTPEVRTFYAMAYNPYGDEKSSYKHSFTCQYMDLANQVLIGKEFWDLVGGRGTYEKVLKIYREVGKEKGPEMIDQLALNY